MFHKFIAFLRATSLWILLAPVALQITGAASNQAVLIANHDKFPVMVNDTKLKEFMEVKEVAQAEHSLPFAWQSTEPDGMIDDIHCVMTPKTHLNAMADIFDMHEAIYSIGDFILMLSGWLGGFAPFVWAFAVVDKLRKVQ